MHEAHVADAPEVGGEWNGSFRPVIMGQGESVGHDPSSSMTPRTMHGETGNWPGTKANEEAKERKRDQLLQQPYLCTY